MKIDCALGLAEQGFRVFPLQPNGKKPATPDGFYSGTCRKDIIESWWTDNPNWNIGVATGGGFFVVDVDNKNGKTGLASLAELELLYDLPHSKRVKTPTGGLHVYLAKDEALKLLSDADHIDGFPGIDIRAEGGYVVGPGSTIDGRTYHVLTAHEMAEAPAAFLPILKRPLAERQINTTIELDLPQNITRAIDYLLNHAKEAIEGAAGDATTFEVAAELRAKGISESLALELMLEHWNETKAHPPWQPDELAIKVANGFQYGQGAPGGKTAAGEFGEVDLGVVPATEAHTENSRPDARLKFLTYADMMAMPEPAWLIEELAQQQRSTVMFGKSNTFKSFLAIDMGLSVATGRPWHGKAVKQGRVLFVATEGANGVGRQRIPGWYNHHGIAEADRANALLYPKEISLDIKEQVDALVQSVRAWGGVSLIVLDIFRGTMERPETEDTTAAEWVKNVQRIMRDTGTAIITVAHTGFAADAQERARMHSHFWGSFDSRMKVDGDKAKLTTVLSIDRHKDADSSGSWGFSLVPTHGTLVPAFDENVRADKAGLPSSLRIAMAALDDAVQAHGVLNMGAHWPDCKVVDMKVWRDFCDNQELSSGEPEAKRKAFQRAKDGLLKRNCIDVHDGFVWSKFGA